MHQDSLRSVVYRSFVTCDDPKGVVECGTIRKSKAGSQKMEPNKIKSQKAKKISVASFPSKVEKKEEMVSKEITEEFHTPSSFQLLEVSRGAQKLNQTIDSWSKGKSYDGQSNDVAKDLLKGALDLQESLMMLGKLQEASQYMAWLKKQQKKSDRGRNDEVGIERVNSCRFGDRDNKTGFQKPRLSADGSSRDCFEELRDSIRDSLARQNLLPKADTEEKTGFHQRYFDSASEIASTSSSQSSLTHTNNYSSTDSPLSSSTPEKKAKGPNLIAKLMGLEEIPAKPLHKQLKNEKISTQPRPMFDIDMRKIRKPRADGQHDKPEQRKLKEILETIHFTGLLKSNSVKELKSYPHHSSYSHTKERLIDNNPPIVLIKPLRGYFPEPEEPFAPMFQERGFLDTRMMPIEQKVKEKFPPKTADKKEKSLKSSNMNRKREAEEILIKRLREEEGAKESEKLAEKPEVKIKSKGCSNKNTSGDVIHQPQRKEVVVDKKADKNPKAMVTSRKTIKKQIEKSKDGARSQSQAKAALQVVRPENRSKDVSRSQVQVIKPEIENSKDVSRSQGQAKATAMKVIKPENGSKVTKNQMRRQQNSSPNPMSNHAKQTTNHTLNDRKRSPTKREKTFNEPTAKLTTEKAGCTEDDRRMDVTCENDSVPVETNDVCVNQLPAEEETDASEFQIGEHCNDAQSSLCDAINLTSKCKRDPMLAEGVDDDISCIGTESKSLNSRTGLKLLLSNNPAFLSLAEELFDVNVNCPTSLQTCGNKNFVVMDHRLSMDCAYELIERISLPDSTMVHPLLLTWLRKSRISVSLDQLLGQVYDGVETLKSYSKLPGENLPIDSLYAMLEKDIRCKGIVSGIWDLGWRSEYSTNETEQVVNDIEKLLLNGLIDEIFT